MELLEAHGSALAGIDRLIGGIDAQDWESPTPCPAWTVRDLLNHLVAEQLWVPELLAGKNVDEIGDRFDGDVLGDDPVGSWQASAKSAREAILRPGGLVGDVNLSRGPTSAAFYCWELTLDLAVHGWDLAKGIGAASPIDPPLAEALLGVFDDEAQEWRQYGGFDPPVPVGPDADAPTRLVALLGRQP